VVFFFCSFIYIYILAGFGDQRLTHTSPGTRTTTAVQTVIGIIIFLGIFGASRMKAKFGIIGSGKNTACSVCW